MPPAATAADAYARARATYLAGRRLDMRELAQGLGVSRTTLYKWCGHREQLLLDVIWAETEAVLRDVGRRVARKRGVNRLREGVRLFFAATLADEALHALLRAETHAGLRLLTGRGGHDDRLIAALAAMIAADVAAGRYALRTRPDLLAHAIVRLVESFLYNDALGALEPRVDDAMEIVDLLLSGATER